MISVMVPGGGSRLRAFVAALGIMSQACGSGGSSPSAPTVASTPLPTPPPSPTPRQTVSLEAAADIIVPLPLMARITSPVAFEMAVTPRRINPPYPSRANHTFEIWLNPVSEDGTNPNIGFAMAWDGNDHWTIGSYSFRGNWYYTRSRFDLPLGQTATVRVTKHAQGIAELFVNGVSMHSVEDRMPSSAVWVRVVGTATDFAYVPVGLNGLAASPRTILPCLFCAVR